MLKINSGLNWPASGKCSRTSLTSRQTAWLAALFHRSSSSAAFRVKSRVPLDGRRTDHVRDRDARITRARSQGLHLAILAEDAAQTVGDLADRSVHARRVPDR